MDSPKKLQRILALKVKVSDTGQAVHSLPLQFGHYLACLEKRKTTYSANLSSVACFFVSYFDSCSFDVPFPKTMT